jgi:hypothetical protein
MCCSPTFPASISDFTYIDMETPLLSDGTNFTGVEAPSLSSSEYDMVSNADIQSEARVDRTGTRNTIENEPSNTQLAGNGPDRSDGPSHALTMNNITLKVIDEVGGIQKYQQMMIQDMKLKQGVAFTLEDSVPAPGERIGDQKPDYEAMSLPEKFWSWWTKREL